VASEAADGEACAAEWWDYLEDPERVIPDRGAYHSLPPKGLTLVKSKTGGGTVFL